MAANQTNLVGDPDQLTTVSTAALGMPTDAKPAPNTSDLYPGGGPMPPGTQPGEIRDNQQGKDSDPTAGVGVEGEEVVWESRYSMKNFIGRLIGVVFATIGSIAIAAYTWGMGHENIAPLTWIVAGLAFILWIGLGIRILQARFSRYYRLTTRRLFLSTGIMNRRRDQMELLRVKDVYTRQQSLLERILGIGTVVVVGKEKELPTFYLVGVDAPKQVMDLIWHHVRAEHDQRSVKVDSI